MRFYTEYFSDYINLREFINKHNIKREDIQTILITRYDHIVLCYWQ